MKKIIYLFLITVLIVSLSACGNKNPSQDTKESTTPNGNMQNSVAINEQQNPISQPQVSGESSNPQASKKFDVDLTKLSSTMVYSEVYNMMNTPNDYIGKTVKMKGQFAYYEDPDTKAQYFACVIADATACCSQGLEFVLTGEHTYPKDYPELGTEITVTGTFEIYTEGESQYCRLANAALVN